MAMKRLFATITMLCCCAALTAGCSDEEDVLPNLQKKIVSYLTSAHSPRLIAEEEIAEQGELPFYSTFANGSVYRYIEGYFNPDRQSRAEVTRTSKVKITFRLYEFTGSAITDSTMPLYTNDAALEAALIEAGLTPGAWRFEPLTVDMRHGGIIKGLRIALVGCREGDTAEAYMTYDMAYGDKNFGVLPRESSVACFFTVNSVE